MRYSAEITSFIDDGRMLVPRVSRTAGNKSQVIKDIKSLMTEENLSGRGTICLTIKAEKTK